MINPPRLILSLFLPVIAGIVAEAAENLPAPSARPRVVVSRWRQEFLLDFARRLARSQSLPR
ncbi:MAG: hypothetical protein RIR76_1848 [Verrucomicrobiota bacterium]|jgi:hypothetical protein|nr:hypothetical protein [Opitutaceae bacterium]